MEEKRTCREGFALSPETKKHLEELAKMKGVSKSSILCWLINTEYYANKNEVKFEQRMDNGYPI